MPASHRSGFHLHAIVPLSIFCSLSLLYPAWYHHTLKIESPMFATKAQAQAWGPWFANERHCLKASVDYRLQSVGDEAVTGDPGPWYGTLRCNQPRIWWRMAAVLILPYLTILFVSRLFFPPEKAPRRP